MMVNMVLSKSSLGFVADIVSLANKALQILRDLFIFFRRNWTRVMILLRPTQKYVWRSRT